MILWQNQNHITGLETLSCKITNVLAAKVGDNWYVEGLRVMVTEEGDHM